MKKGRKQSIGKIITILILMSAFLVGCKEDTPASTTVEDTPESTDELLTENTEDSTTTVDKDSANEFTDGSESTVEDSDKDTSTSNTDESTEDNNNNESTEEKDNNESTEDKDNNESTESTEVKEPEGNTSSEVTPPVEEEPVTPPPATTVPSVSWSGTGVTLGSLGITIPTLSHFNSEALTDNTNNTFWTGDSSDTPTVQTMYDTLNGIANAVISTGVIGENAQTFAVEQYRISWSWTSFSSTMDYSLRRDPLTQTYTLELNLPFDSYVSSFGVDVTSYNQDIIRTLISCFSSNVNEVYSYIYKGIYEDASVLNTSKYKTVGDCKIKFGSESYITEDNIYHLVFYIKGN